MGAGIIVHRIQHSNNHLQHYAEIIDSTIAQIDSSSAIKFEEQELIARNKKDSTFSVKQKDDRNSVNKNLLAYAVNEELEKLVERYTETSLRGDFSVNIKSIIEIKSNEDLVFEWNNTNKENLTLEFFNNSGDKLFEEKTSENRFTTTGLSNSGLYYWKLINEDFDLLFCGKIIVK